MGDNDTDITEEVRQRLEDGDEIREDSDDDSGSDPLLTLDGRSSATRGDAGLKRDTDPRGDEE